MQTLTSEALLEQQLGQTAEQSSKVSKFALHAKTAFWAFVGLFFITSAYAQGDDAGFVDIEALDTLWLFFSGLVTGMLGKILALLALVACFWQGFEQNWRAAAGAGLVCLALAFGPNLIEGLFSAGVPI